MLVSCLRDEPIPRLRHYFINHLVGVVEGNVRYKREVGTSIRETRLANIDDGFAAVTPPGMMQRPKALPSIQAIRRVDEAPQPILSTDWNSRRSLSLNARFTWWLIICPRFAPHIRTVGDAFTRSR